MDTSDFLELPQPVRWPLPNALASAESEDQRWMKSWWSHVSKMKFGWWIEVNFVGVFSMLFFDKCHVIQMVLLLELHSAIWYEFGCWPGKTFNAISFKPHQGVTWGTCGESKPTNPPSNDSGAHGIVAEESKMQHPFSWNWYSKMQVRNVIYESFTGSKFLAPQEWIKTYGHENHNPIPAVQFNKYIEIMKLLAKCILATFHTPPKHSGLLNASGTTGFFWWFSGGKDFQAEENININSTNSIFGCFFFGASVFVMQTATQHNEC